jgi:hypothetical protein
MNGRRQVKEGFLSFLDNWDMDCVCVPFSIPFSVNGAHTKCLWTGYGSRHQLDKQPTWQALEWTWASIPVECFRHLVESMHWQIEAVLISVVVEGIRRYIPYTHLFFCGHCVYSLINQIFIGIFVFLDLIAWNALQFFFTQGLCSQPKTPLINFSPGPGNYSWNCVLV